MELLSSGELFVFLMEAIFRAVRRALLVLACFFFFFYLAQSPKAENVCVFEGVYEGLGGNKSTRGHTVHLRLP